MTNEPSPQGRLVSGCRKHLFSSDPNWLANEFSKVQKEPPAFNHRFPEQGVDQSASELCQGPVDKQVLLLSGRGHGTAWFIMIGCLQQELFEFLRHGWQFPDPRELLGGGLLHFLECGKHDLTRVPAIAKVNPI